MKKLAFKKVFLFTITLSMILLIGAVIIQFNWIYNLNQLRNQTLNDKVALAINDFIHNYLINDIKIWDKDFSNADPNNTTFKKNFDKAFSKIGLDNIKYEFAIKGSGAFGAIKEFYLYKTPHFGDYPISNYNVYTTPIQSGNGLQDLFLGKYELITYVDKAQTGFYYNIIGTIIIAILFTILFSLTLYLYVQTIVSARKINQLKTDFINNMTHELKTPIATINLSADALSKDAVIINKEKVKEFSQIIKMENKRMLNIVERVLEAGKFEKREIVLKSEKIQMHTLIDTVFVFFETIFQNTNATVNFQKKATYDTILGDKFHVQQAISNIFDNAVKYSSKKRPLKISVTTENKNNYLIITIRDNGIGIPKDEQDKIFEQFYRTPTGNIHNVKGFGLGLSYVKSIIENMNGYIHCDSAVDKETIFTIACPLYKE